MGRHALFGASVIVFCVALLGAGGSRSPRTSAGAAARSGRGG
jgi:hypothetical protein